MEELYREEGDVILRLSLSPPTVWRNIFFYIVERTFPPCFYSSLPALMVEEEIKGSGTALHFFLSLQQERVEPIDWTIHHSGWEAWRERERLGFFFFLPVIRQEKYIQCTEEQGLIFGMRCDFLLYFLESVKNKAFYNT